MQIGLSTSKHLPRLAVAGVFLCVFALLAACKPVQPANDVQSMKPNAGATPVFESSWIPAMPETRHAPATSKPSLPKRFQRYGANALGDGLSCVTGVVTDEDGMNQRPMVVLEKGADTIEWVEQLDGIEGTYQARATHCVQGGDVLYVLLQSDTQPAQTMSQTLLSVARLDMRGQVQATHAIDLPDLHDQAYSAWVEDQPAAFRLEGGKLAINGQYFLMTSPDDHKPFTTTIDLK